MTQTKIKQIVAKQLGILDESVDPKHHLVNDLGADSLDLIELVMSIEQAFKVPIEEGEYEQALTVDGIAQLVDKKLAK
jgi:acyl carrier protein